MFLIFTRFYPWEAFNSIFRHTDSVRESHNTAQSSNHKGKRNSHNYVYNAGNFMVVGKKKQKRFCPPSQRFGFFRRQKGVRTHFQKRRPFLSTGKKTQICGFFSRQLEPKFLSLVFFRPSRTSLMYLEVAFFLVTRKKLFSRKQICTSRKNKSFPFQKTDSNKKKI